MQKLSVWVKKRLFFALFCVVLWGILLIIRVCYIQTVKAEDLQKMAYEQQTRDRLITAKRGSLLDRNGEEIAATQSVCAVSVIHNQLENKEQAASFLSRKLNLDYDDVLKKVSKKVALVRIKKRVDEKAAQEIRQANIKGIVVDEDVERVYPFGNLASHVRGFVGGDNQGIIGLESKYEKYLSGKEGKILTLTDSRGLEISDAQERIEPERGYDIVTSLDVSVQKFAQQTIAKAVEAKNAKRGLIIVMNPQNGEIYALADYPEFDLNEPFEINNDELKAKWNTLTEKQQNDELNKMWRNTAINDTYEPGSTFKIVTSSAGLETGAVTPSDTFVCNGYYIAGDRMIKCWRYPRTHGSETFVQGVQNSCNPVFMAVAQRMGAETFYDYMVKFGFTQKTGVDLNGEAVGIIHKKENIGPVELATMSFGQSFQITPLQLLRAASAIVNGGYLITPHFAVKAVNEKGHEEVFDFEKGEQVISGETSTQMREILESVVSQGTGSKTYISGYKIGGKTATSEKLPRRSGKYIASFMSFAPADNPKVMCLVLIDEPQGVYYGGTVAGPVMKELLTNILPYFGVERDMTGVKENEQVYVYVPDLKEKKISEAKKILNEISVSAQIKGEGETVEKQFPEEGEKIIGGTKVILYTE